MKTTLTIIFILIFKLTLGQLNYCECSMSVWTDESKYSTIFLPTTIVAQKIKRAYISIENDTFDIPKIVISFNQSGYVKEIKNIYKYGRFKTTYYRNSNEKITSTEFVYLDSLDNVTKSGGYYWKYFYSNDKLIKQNCLYKQTDEVNDSTNFDVNFIHYPNENLMVIENWKNSLCRNCHRTKFIRHIYSFTENQKQNIQQSNIDSIAIQIKVLNKLGNLISESGVDKNKRPYYTLLYYYDKLGKLIKINHTGSNGECVEQNGYTETFEYGINNLPKMFIHQFDNTTCKVKIRYE